ERLVAAFGAFLARVREGGRIIAGSDSPRLRNLLAGAPAGSNARLETYALEREADWTAAVHDRQYPQRFAVRHRGQVVGDFETPLVGRHMVANCLAAIAALRALGVPVEAVQDAIARFRGARRRFELVGE